MARVQPIRPRDWPPGMMEAMAAALRPDDATHPPAPRDPSSPKGLNAMGVMAHHPAVTLAFNQLISHALYYTTITPRQRELLVLRVAHLRNSPYEWAQHVYQGSKSGLTADEIARVRIGPEAEAWSATDRALLSAADELVTDAQIADGTYAALTSELDTQQMMDVVFTVGAYEAFAMFLRTFDVDVDDDLQPFC
jgi:alkylhydroperoxidase family enzyme